MAISAAMPSPTAEPSCFVEPRRTSPAANTPGIDVLKPPLSSTNPRGVEVDDAAKKGGVGVEPDEHEGGARVHHLLLSAVPVTEPDRFELALAGELDDLGVAMHDEMRVVVDLVLEQA